MSAYGFAHLGGGLDLYALRLRGVGLANMLFPWARCVVASHRYRLRRIVPTWPQIAHRHWLRNDPDKRWYGHLFQPAPDEVSGLARWNRLLFGHKVSEDMLPQGVRENDVVVFSGMNNFFQGMLHDHELVRAALLACVRPPYLRPVTEQFHAPLAVHVRLGDFLPPSHHGPPAAGFRTPLEWYADMIREIHRALGPLDTHIFSDGTGQELAPLLALPRVRRTTFGHSVPDLLALSLSAILITSNSTFSMWAAYLGRQPVIWRPDWLPGPLYPGNPAAELESSGDLPEAFLAQCRLSLDGKSP